jgi:hypothetical protein
MVSSELFHQPRLKRHEAYIIIAVSLLTDASDVQENHG